MILKTLALLFRNPAKAGFFIWFGLLSTTLGACTFKKDEISRQTILQVDGTKVSVREFAKKLSQKLTVYDALAAKDVNNIIRAKESVVQEYVLQNIVQRWANANKISISQSELEAEINRVRGAFPDDLTFRRELAQQGLSFNEWVESLQFSLLERALFKNISSGISPPTEAELQSYYDANKSSFKKAEQIYVRQIVVKDLAEAERIRESLRGKDFANMANTFSISPEGKSGGLVGWIEKGTLEAFDKAFSLPLNQTSPIIESPYGFHIIRVEKKQPAGAEAFASAKKRIRLLLASKKEQAVYSAWLDKQLRELKVLRNNALINALSVETRGE